MNETNLETFTGRLRRRRRYLWRTALFGALGTVLLGLVVASIAVLAMSPMLVFVFGPVALVGTAILFLISAGLCFALSECDAVADAIRYIPPVHKQIADLPAADLLLRGADRAPATPEQFLRSITDANAPARELLRSTSGNAQ